MQQSILKKPCFYDALKSDNFCTLIFFIFIPFWYQQGDKRRKDNNNVVQNITDCIFFSCIISIEILTSTIVQWPWEFQPITKLPALNPNSANKRRLSSTAKNWFNEIKGGCLDGSFGEVAIRYKSKMRETELYYPDE